MTSQPRPQVTFSELLLLLLLVLLYGWLLGDALT